MSQATLNYFDQSIENPGREFALERLYDLWCWASDPVSHPAIWAPGTNFSASSCASFQTFLQHIQILINFARMGDLNSINPRKRKCSTAYPAPLPKRQKLQAEATVMSHDEFNDFQKDIRLKFNRIMQYYHDSEGSGPYSSPSSSFSPGSP